jgi:hypothetical protein
MSLAPHVILCMNHLIDMGMTTLLLVCLGRAKMMSVPRVLILLSDIM